MNSEKVTESVMITALCVYSTLQHFLYLNS